MMININATAKQGMSDHGSEGVPGPASGFAGSTGPGYFIPGAEIMPEESA